MAWIHAIELETEMHNCPACGIENVGHDTKCRCGSDLSLLLQVETLADVWFNRALVELHANRHGRAIEWLSATCALRPSDAVALRVQSKVWAQLGHYAEALDALERSAEFEPDAPQLREIAAALQDVKANQESRSTEIATAPLSSEGSGKAKRGTAKKRSERPAGASQQLKTTREK